MFGISSLCQIVPEQRDLFGSPLLLEMIGAGIARAASEMEPGKTISAGIGENFPIHHVIDAHSVELAQRRCPRDFEPPTVRDRETRSDSAPPESGKVNRAKISELIEHAFEKLALVRRAAEVSHVRRIDVEKLARQFTATAHGFEVRLLPFANLVPHFGR